MAVIEDLTDKEKALVAIFSDPSGLDLAEFVFVDEEQDDKIWRAWPFQWKWYRCEDPLQVSQCARAVGKSQSIKIRAFAFPFIHPGNEMVVTAPELVHLEPISSLIENVFFNTRLGREMIQTGRSAVTHRPFQLNFKNGARIIGRIPQKDGKGVKGLHPIWLEQDESQDYPEPGWKELEETLKRGKEGAVRRAHGVTRGVRDYFWKVSGGGGQYGGIGDKDYDNSATKWTVHTFTAMHRPNWTDEERQEKIAAYGGYEDPDYRRNVLGEHGDETSPIFVLHRLMHCVDDEKGTDYNTIEYLHHTIKDSMLIDSYGDRMDILDELRLPYEHLKDGVTFWAGMDVGFTNHPSEILVFAEEMISAAEEKELKRRQRAIPPKGMTRLKLVTRISLIRIGNPDQVKAILKIIDFYKPKAFAMDKTGNGLGLFQEVQDQNRVLSTTIKGYNFSGKILVDFDQSIEVEPWEDQEKEAGIHRNVVEYSTDQLRRLVDEKRIWLPWDEDLLSEFMGQTYKVTKTALNPYGKREYSLGKFHALDASRMAVLGWSQELIDAATAPNDEPVLDMFFS